MSNLFLKPIIKKIIAYIATKNNVLDESELNEWIAEYGFDVEVEFKDGKMYVNKKA